MLGPPIAARPVPALSCGDGARALTSVRIDHVIYGTADPDATAMRLRAKLGVRAVAGGRHDGLGTRNRIVPLEDRSFLELLAVADPREAKRSALGASLQDAIARGEWLLGWAVAVDHLQPVVQRLGTPVTHVGRQGMTARLTGVAGFLAEHAFRSSSSATDRRLLRGAAAPAAPGICWIEVARDARRLRHWLGGVDLPVRVVDGEPAVRAVGFGEHELRTGVTRAPGPAEEAAAARAGHVPRPRPGARPRNAVVGGWPSRRAAAAAAGCASIQGRSSPRGS
jgi:hypothetical protein